MRPSAGHLLKNRRRAERYAYLRTVVGLDCHAAQVGSQSVKAMLALVPNHSFPLELCERRKSGPQVVYGPRTPKSAERQRRYRECRALGMPGSMASEGSVCDGSMQRVKREWAQLARKAG